MKLREYTSQQRKWIVATIKEGLDYPLLLTGFESQFILDFAHRYRDFGDDVNIEPKQYTVFEDLHNKLFGYVHSSN